MAEPQSPDETGSLIGKTNLISGPDPVQLANASTADPAGASHPTAHAAGEQPHPTQIARFEVRACLGGGAFGWVYRAFDPTLRREVAIKLPRAERLQTERDRSRFLNEARAAATIRHPQVVPVHEVGEVDGVPFIVMGYVAGPTLADVVRDRVEPFAPAEAAKIVQSLALAVQAAHDKGVVHRDLKPGNVLLDSEHGQYVVTDFGLARVVDPNDPRASTTGIAGTPAYMPPEQARGDSAAIGPRSDVYALGVILFELLTGKLPFTGASVADVISKVLMVPPPSASAIGANIPHGLDRVCRQAMAKLPDERFASAQELAATLAPFTVDQQAQVSTVLLASPPSVDVAARLKGFRRVRKLAPLAVLLLAVFPLLVMSLGKNANSTFDPGAGSRDLDPRPGNLEPKTSPDRRAAEWVLEVGGSLTVRERESARRFAPKTLTDMPAKDFHVLTIDLNKPNVVTDEAVVRNLQGLTALEFLYIRHAQKLSDEGLAALARLPELRALTIGYGSRLTDKGIESLAKHPLLHEVNFSGTRMTAQGVAHLATIPNLEALGFHGHAITDDWLKAASQAQGLLQLYSGYSQGFDGAKLTAAGFAHLKKLNGLYLLDLDTGVIAPGALKELPGNTLFSELYLRKLDIADEDLDQLLHLRALKTLGLHETKVTDKGMATVAKMAQLERLFLDGTDVSDEGLMRLVACKRLTEISAPGTKITAEGIAEFNKSLPNCKIAIKAPK